ncbi:unnamed protein product [Somion occarium]|uniref:Uncharacterized protein n=1 Tax=Somion occarium TaxID=3059160 RepID=A0ABP1DWD2_9APHY
MASISAQSDVLPRIFTRRPSSIDLRNPSIFKHLVDFRAEFSLVTFATISDKYNVTKYVQTEQQRVNHPKGVQDLNRPKVKASPSPTNTIPAPYKMAPAAKTTPPAITNGATRSIAKPLAMGCVISSLSSVPALPQVSAFFLNFSFTFGSGWTSAARYMRAGIDSEC